MANTVLSELLHDTATPSRLVPALCSGLVLGVLCVVIELSLASLIFSGPLARFAPSAAGLTLCGALIMCVCGALLSGARTAICAPQDAPAAVMASVAAGVAASLAQGGQLDCAPVTVTAAMALSTLATGLMLLAMGRFGLGNLMRFVPYPVVGGFMAGIGWLLVQGGVSIVTGASLTLHDLPMLLVQDRLLRLLPAALLAGGLLVALSRFRSVFILPGALAAAVAAFLLYLLASGRTLMDAKLAGLLLGAMPDGGALWPVFGPADLAQIRWAALTPEIPQLLTIPLVSTISLLLTTSGIETATRTDQDLGRELAANGAANMLGALSGAQAGYTALSLSLLGPKTGADSRLSGLVCALVIGAATFSGAGVLGYFPRFILGGMVLFLGVATLMDWLVGARRSVSRVDYALMLSILCAIAAFGFLAGVAFGVVAASVIFVVKYSRLPVLRRQEDGPPPASTRRRPVPDQHILRQAGAEMRLLRATGYLFFGSANLLNRSVAACLQPESGPPPAFLILDLGEVTGFDSSAAQSFVRMLQRAETAGCRMLFAAPPAGLEEQLRQGAPAETEAALFPASLDAALEHCEDALLERAHKSLAGGQAQERERLFDLAVDDMLSRLEDAERFEALVERLGQRLEVMEAPAGETLLRQGETPDGVWLLLSGQAEESLTEADGALTRLRTLEPGCLAGLAAPKRGSAQRTTLTALTACRLGFLSAESLRRLTEEDPAAALGFHALYSTHLEARLADLLARGER